MHGQKFSLGCRRPGALTAGAQGANMAEREQSPISPPRRGANPLWTPTNDLLPNQSSRAHVHSSAVFSPLGFSPFLLCFWHGCCCTSLQGDGERRLIWTESESGAVLYNQENLCPADGPLLLLRLCPGTEIFPLFFLQHPLGVLTYSSNNVVLAKPFVGAVLHCQAEPSSHLYKTVSLSLSDLPQLIPLHFSEPQLYLDLKPVENRSISSFVSPPLHLCPKDNRNVLPGFMIQRNWKISGRKIYILRLSSHFWIAL